MYLVKELVAHSETLELMVLYEPLYETGIKFWVRPLDLFVGQVEIEGKKVNRFEPVEN